MRPRGEIRLALHQSAELLGPATWIDLAKHAKVGFRVARQTVQAMLRAGELEHAGLRRMDHARRPMHLVRVVNASAVPASTLPDLVAALQAWSASPPGVQASAQLAHADAGRGEGNA